MYFINIKCISYVFINVQKKENKNDIFIFILGKNLNLYLGNTMVSLHFIFSYDKLAQLKNVS